MTRLNSQVDHFGDIGQIVERKSHRFGSPVVEEAEVVRVACRLEIKQPHGVPGLAGSGRYQFEA